MVDKKHNKKNDKKKKETSYIKTIWDKYVQRLNKITNGKPQCCK